MRENRPAVFPRKMSGFSYFKFPADESSMANLIGTLLCSWAWCTSVKTAIVFMTLSTTIFKYCEIFHASCLTYRR